MMLKRIYKKFKDDKGVEHVDIDRVEVWHTGVDAKQSFSERLVNAAVAEGWMTLSKGQILVHAQDPVAQKPVDLAYKVLQRPGRYCLHCGIKLDDDATGSLARKHVAEKHSKAKSPDASNPAGYEMLKEFYCELDAAQHEKFKFKGTLVQRPRAPAKAAAK